MRRLLPAIVLTTVVSVALVGCSSNDSSDSTTTTAKAPSTKDTATKDIGSNGSKSFSVETPDGQASISLDGELPPNWPKAFPAPARSEVAGSGSLAGESSGVMVGVYTTKQSASDVFDSYKTNGDLKVSDAKSVSPGSVFLGTMKISGTYDGSVSVTSVSGTTYVVVVLRGGGGSGSASTTTSPSGGSSTASTSTTSTTTAAG